MQCSGTWEPSPKGLYCSLCDTEWRWDDGPPYSHGKLSVDFWTHGLTGSTKQCVFDTLFQRQQGKCAICGISQAELEAKAREVAVDEAKRRKKELGEPRSDHFAKFLEVNEGFAEWQERREKVARNLSQEELVEHCYQSITVQWKLHIDHCHATGMIRGLLCNQCNGLLAVAENNGFLRGTIVSLVPFRSFGQKYDAGSDCPYYDWIDVYPSEWLSQHLDTILLYMQRDRWLPRKDILFHLQSHRS